MSSFKTRKKRNIMKPIKVVVVGDANVGKTGMLLTYANKVFPSDLQPTTIDTYSADEEIDGESFNLSLWDTSGAEGHKEMRSYAYATDVFLVCFSIADQKSWENVRAVWVPEIQRDYPEAPIILVGLKSDLRKDSLGVPGAIHFKSKYIPKSHIKVGT